MWPSAIPRPISRCPYRLNNANVHAIRNVKRVPNCVQVMRTQDVVICKSSVANL